MVLWEVRFRRCLELLAVVDMPIFGNKEKPDLKFAKRADAFGYMLAYQLDKGKDPMEAARLANEFADIYASNHGIPVKEEPKPEGVDKYLVSIDKVVCYCEAHPQLLDFITGAITFAAGTFFGKKAEQHSELPKFEKIDVNQLD